MEGMDTKTMIHIGTELLLIGGLGFWMKKRVDTLDAKVDDLEKKISAYEEIISQQQSILARHEEMLRKVFGMPPLQLQGAPPQGQPQSGVPPQEQPPQNPPQSSTSKTTPAAKASPKSASKSSPPPEKKEEVPEEDISPEDLDKILNDELNRTQSIEIDTAEPENGASVSESPTQIRTSTEALKPKRKVVAVRKKKTT